ncbi:hypothetical protein [Cerasicoccus frondis]|uniref:hypothetical protein n=1 Tax=Cerasicoccus frondis TaxID=490090 RepID=UPI002852A9EE|nr:hypothetical protein [Cerasicoccus frondis]
MKTHRKAISPETRGFAVVVALVLMAFLFLLLMSLATVTRVEVMSTQHIDQGMEARQNAYLGMMVALSELQKHSGPDQRVTAKADLVTPASDDEMTYGEILDYWGASRNPQWTGVWLNANETEFDPNDPIAFNAEPERQAWLVSGGEIGISLDPESAVVGLSANTAPQDTLRDGNGNDHKLLISPANNATNTLRAVTAPLVPVIDDQGLESGNYAWWVGDEGVKARVDLVDEYHDSTDDVAPMKRLASAQRMGIEAMTANDSLAEDDLGLDTFYEPNNERYADVTNEHQLALLNPNDDYIQALDVRFHDITTHSRGVLADVKHGGLKRDLSYILGQPDLASFREALNQVYDVPVAPAATNNRVLTEDVTPLVELPENVAGANYDFDEAPGILAFTPTWEQLWSFHNMSNLETDVPAGVWNNAGQATPRVNTPLEHGLAPIVTQAKVFYNLDFDADGVIWVETRPLVVLANPYAVPLAPADYTYSFSKPSLRLCQGGDKDDPDYPLDPYNPEVIAQEVEDLYDENGDKIGEKILLHSSFTDKDEAYSVTGAGMGSAVLTIRDANGLQPGEARVYTLSSTSNLPTSTSGQKSHSLVMTNEYDLLNCVRMNTGKKIVDRYEYAALFCSSARVEARLYLDYNASDGDKKLVQYLVSKPTSSSDKSQLFLVYPENAGHRDGGGIGFSIYDINDSTLQQSMFYQLNYRAPIISPSGYTSQTHPLEWARTLTKKGEVGNSDLFGANLLWKEDSDWQQVRWGALHTGAIETPTVTPSSVAGTDIGFYNYLYDIPRQDVPMTSLGQFQHFNTSALTDRSYWGSSSYGANTKAATIVQSWQMNYPLSNSYAHLRVKRDRLFDALFYSGYHYDGSYLWNDVLWDRFYFSTFPASGTVDLGNELLVNQRYRPFRDTDQVSLADVQNFRGDGDSANAANSRMAAVNLLSDGAFNVNSTSKEAWKALFSSLRNVPIGSETNETNLTAPFSRTFEALGGASGAESALSENSWNGFRNLSPAEVDALAEEMVRQVRLRGPFTSMSDFVNRRLAEANNDPNDLGVSGALQSALDAVVNLESHLQAPFDEKSSASPVELIADSDFRMNSAVAGFPGYLLQADVLSSLGQYMTVRSDTFRIRSYGNVTSPISGQVEAEAWCEAIVQRMPDYVRPTDGVGGNEPYEDATDPVNQRLGRRYEIVSFRWLKPDEI